MKTSTLNTLIVAKSIFSETKALINSGDKHSCTAGIILLQDYVELIVLAVLDELDIDETRSIASKSFDELLGEIKKQKIKIIKSGTIKALNKQRVISKHYGQLAEPTSVINYFNVAMQFSDDLLKKVIGKNLQEIFLTDLIQDETSQGLVHDSISKSDQNNFLDALIGLRKAFFLAYEYQYSVYPYKNIEENQPLLGLFALNPEGFKSPYWTKNKKWIDDNVKTPIDFIQIDHDKLKTDCMELGVNTVDIENFRRLTPEAIRTDTNDWHFAYSQSFEANELNKENFNYCLDILINFLLKKQEFDSSKRYPKNEKSIPAPKIYIGKPLFIKPSQTSSKIDTVQQGHRYYVYKTVTGFNCSEKYLYVNLFFPESEKTFEGNNLGYLLIEE